VSRRVIAPIIALALLFKVRYAPPLRQNSANSRKQDITRRLPAPPPPPPPPLSLSLPFPLGKGRPRAQSLFADLPSGTSIPIRKVARRDRYHGRRELSRSPLTRAQSQSRVFAPVSRENMRALVITELTFAAAVIEMSPLGVTRRVCSAHFQARSHTH
jgi:hypothetical protein